MIQEVRVGDKLLSYDIATAQLYTDDVILMNNHENIQGICETVRFYFGKDEEVFLELQKHHLAFVRDQDGTYTEKEASKVKAGDHMLIFGEGGDGA